MKIFTRICYQFHNYFPSIVFLLLLVFAGQVKASTTKSPLTRPNILFIVVDDLNTSLGTYGHDLVKSPNIDALARRGVQFDHAYAQAPMCTPSRESFLTGLYPGQNGVIGHGDHFRNHPNFRDHVPKAVTLPQLFRKNGYNVARVGKIYHQGVPGGIGKPGPDDKLSWDQTFDPKGIETTVDDKIQSIHKNKENRNFGGTLSWLNLPGDGLEHTDGKVATRAIKLLQELNPQKAGKPFFLAVGFYRPHTPYIAPPEYFDLYPLEKIKLVKNIEGDRRDIPPAALSDKSGQRQLKTPRIRKIMQAYYAAISFMDAQMGRVIDELNQLGLDKNTIIVFVSDHGYQLGSHGGLWQKSTLFEEATRVPLIISAPGKYRAEQAEGPVELVDLYPTLAALAGLKAPDYLPGKSLVPVLDNPKTSVRVGALSMLRSRAGWMNSDFRYKDLMGYSIRTKHYRYTVWGDGNWGIEMYDHDHDPHEFTNLGDKTPIEDKRMRLKRLLATRRAEANRRIPEIEVGAYGEN